MPGRLGSNQGPVPYANAYPTSGGLCATAGHCVMQATGDGAVSCVGNGTTWTQPITVWRGQTFQAEAGTRTRRRHARRLPAVRRRQSRRLHRLVELGHLQRRQRRRHGTANLVVYYEDADTTATTRAFNVKVNGGPVQHRTFAPVGGDWTVPSSIAVGSVNIALTAS